MNIVSGYVKSSKSMFGIIFALALVSPSLPKIGVGRDFSVTILEIGLILSALLLPTVLIRSLLLKEIRLFSLSVFFIFVSTLVWSMFEPDFSGFLRLLKLILYFQLFYYGYYFMTAKKCLALSYAGLVAMVIGLCYFLLIQVPEYGYDNWNVEAINSGFSNKFIDIRTASLETVAAGAHGIWTVFCLLAFSVYVSFKSVGRSGPVVVTFFLMMLLAHVLFSVSREGLLSLSIFVILGSIYLLRSQSGLNFIFLSGAIVLSAVFISWAILPYLAVLDFGIVEKINYTANSLSDSGTETNLLLRINSWKAFVYSLPEIPHLVLTGVGWSELRYGLIQDLSYVPFYYARLPESLFFSFFAYGGIFSLSLFVLFYWKVVMCSLRLNHSKYVGVFFISVVPASLFSGAALIADLVMGMAFLVVGYILRNKTEEERLRNG